MNHYLFHALIATLRNWQEQCIGFLRDEKRARRVARDLAAKQCPAEWVRCRVRPVWLTEVQVADLIAGWGREGKAAGRPVENGLKLPAAWRGYYLAGYHSA